MQENIAISESSLTPLLADSLNQLLFYHGFFAYFFIIPFVWNLILLFSGKSMLSITNKMFFVAPITFFLLLVSFFSGLNLLFFLPDQSEASNLGLPVILMIIFFIFALVGEIKRIKKLKVARRTSMEAMIEYVKYCKILYACDVAFYALIMLLMHF